MGRAGRPWRGAWAWRALLSPSRRRRAAEQISADDSDGRYDEKPQHGQERHPDDGERQLVHVRPRPWTLVGGARVSRCPGLRPGRPGGRPAWSGPARHDVPSVSATRRTGWPLDEGAVDWNSGPPARPGRFPPLAPHGVWTRRILPAAGHSPCPGRAASPGSAARPVCWSPPAERQSPGAGETSSRGWPGSRARTSGAGRRSHPSLAALDGGGPDDAGPDPERARWSCRAPLESPSAPGRRTSSPAMAIPGRVGQARRRGSRRTRQALVVGLRRSSDDGNRSAPACAPWPRWRPDRPSALDRAGHPSRSSD